MVTEVEWLPGTQRGLQKKGSPHSGEPFEIPSALAQAEEFLAYSRDHNSVV